jgi:hypothetical protein
VKSRYEPDLNPAHEEMARHYGVGVVFKLTPGEVETVLYNFGSSSTDGVNPIGNLTRDSSGNL